MTQNQKADVTVTYADGVGTISINRPEKLNAIRLQTYHDLIDSLRDADRSPECKIIVLQGEGGKFTAGNDLADLIDGDPMEVAGCVQGIFETVAGLSKVIVAAVEGVAVGIGTTILLHCDMVIAAANTRFRVPFANLGVCPEGASSLFLPVAVGDKRAREILLTGRFFSAEEALNWGLVNYLSEPGQARTMADEYVTMLLQQPLESLLATKRLLKSHLPDVSKVVAAELDEFSTLLGSEKTRKRIAALLQRQ